MAEITLADVINVMNAVLTRLDGIDGRLGGMDGRLDGMDGRLDGIRTGLRILSAKQENSTKGRVEPLVVVPKPDGLAPMSEYPVIEELLVAGNETLPSGRTNSWSAKKSLHLIREYEPGYITEGEEGEGRSRPRRLKVAQLLGITSAQLSFGLLAL